MSLPNAPFVYDFECGTLSFTRLPGNNKLKDGHYTLLSTIENLTDDLPEALP